MKLDKRIIDGKKPFDCLDAESETVKSFIGKKGYFANHISEFIDISDLEEDVLTSINPDEPDCEVYKATCTTWEYFLPAEWVKEPENKYRPFSLNEFLNRYRLGNTVYFRRIGYKEVKCAMFVEYVRGESPEENQIVLGNMRYTLAYLFKNHELSLEDIWQPFGVIEDD